MVFLSVVQGEDYLDAPSLNAGAKGLVSGLCNVWVKPYIEIIGRSTKWPKIRGEKLNKEEIHKVENILKGLKFGV